RGYAFAGPEVRRMTAEQFADAAGAMTGEWNAYPGRPARPGGVYAREWRAAAARRAAARARQSLQRGVCRPLAEDRIVRHRRLACDDAVAARARRRVERARTAASGLGRRGIPARRHGQRAALVARAARPWRPSGRRAGAG